MHEGRVIDIPANDDGPRCGDVDEAALVARAVRDRAAFAPLYARYVGPVYGYCYRCLGKTEDAEDATSQTFYQALAALPRYHGASFSAWLFAIAHNVVVDMCRRRRPYLPLDAVPDPISLAPSPEDIALAADDRRRVLASLSPAQRMVVELRLIGLRGAEIAAVLGRSLASVKMLQQRAAKRVCLDGWDHDIRRERSDERP